MPSVPQRPCRYPGCPRLCAKGQVYCDEHRAFSAERQRGGARARGYNNEWDKARTLYLRDHPLCVACMRENRLTAATVVDHIVPHRGDRGLFWDRSNWQALCKACHDRKTGEGL